ncbi:sulfur carrier protein ThiS [Sulfuricurvum sp.]|uniref:sulfur carrier protein ThiS n=1 Tax=Sulfuricurvum sp. TaxID=2025608 RepID=UPI002636A3D5|nr:sulfur carrier protein ThiS [Sulfuricurvum sp.]MDD2838585.1 sulfur carrier protein ThiS [Sulfuricurvum sp.]MDD3595919.1 sulfur carrier protein ThiS [Sulfuricurvum sp.]
MQIKVNGELREMEEGATLYALISALKLEERVMAAALNMQIVKQEKWKEARLQEGDVIELLDFVGGG